MAQVDVLVSGVGTGGTITGISRYIKKEKGKPILSVAVETDVSPVISQTLQREPVKPGPHKIQGIGAGFVPKNWTSSMVDRVEPVTNEESIEMARGLPEGRRNSLRNFLRRGSGGRAASGQAGGIPRQDSWWCSPMRPSATSPARYSKGCSTNNLARVSAITLKND